MILVFFFLFFSLYLLLNLSFKVSPCKSWINVWLYFSKKSIALLFKNSQLFRSSGIQPFVFHEALSKCLFSASRRKEPQGSHPFFFLFTSCLFILLQVSIRWDKDVFWDDHFSTHYMEYIGTYFTALPLNSYLFIYHIEICFWFEILKIGKIEKMNTERNMKM